MVVGSPTDDLARICQDAGMTAFCRDAVDSDRESGDIDGFRVEGIRRIVAQLTKFIVPPASHLPAGRQDTGVAPSGGDGFYRTLQTGHLFGGWPVDGGSIPQLSVSITSPASHDAGGKQRAGMIVSGRDGGDSDLRYVLMEVLVREAAHIDR
jgi:hypothetical protein